MADKQREEPRKGTVVPGFASLGLNVVGISGIYLALWQGEPLGLIGSALAFGIIIWVAFK
tara:strand:+ start:4302 stop:4481 length:180 start_codon:yes stop_codon:yes gene_type:complete